MSEDSYDRLRERLAAGLESAAAAQAAGRREQIGSGCDEVDSAIPRADDPRYVKLLVALTFWEGWVDSWNHNWQFYEPICESDWPRLALEVVGDLRADREIQNELVLAQFDWRRRKEPPSLWRRLKSALGVA